MNLTNEPDLRLAGIDEERDDGDPLGRKIYGLSEERSLTCPRRSLEPQVTRGRSV
jgi:hypothetical protein